MFNFIYVPLPKKGRTSLSCTWVETRDSRQPLLCLWIDSEMRAFRIDEQTEEEEEEDQRQVCICRAEILHNLK